MDPPPGQSAFSKHKAVQQAARAYPQLLNSVKCSSASKSMCIAARSHIKNVTSVCCRRYCLACPRWLRPTCSVSALTPRRTACKPANAGDFVPRRLLAPPPRASPDPDPGGGRFCARSASPANTDGAALRHEPGLVSAGLRSKHALLGAMSPPAAPPAMLCLPAPEPWQGLAAAPLAAAPAGARQLACRESETRLEAGQGSASHSGERRVAEEAGMWQGVPSSGKNPEKGAKGMPHHAGPAPETLALAIVPRCGGSSERSEDTGVRGAGACAGSGPGLALEACDEGGGCKAAQVNSGCGALAGLGSKNPLASPRCEVAPLHVAGATARAVEGADARGGDGGGSSSAALSGGNSGGYPSSGAPTEGATRRSARCAATRDAEAVTADPDPDPTVGTRQARTSSQAGEGLSELEGLGEPLAAGPQASAAPPYEQAPGRARKRKSQHVLSGAARVAACLPAGWAASRVGQALTLALPPGAAAAVLQCVPAAKKRRSGIGGQENHGVNPDSSPKPAPAAGEPPAKKRRGRPPRIDPETGLPLAKRHKPEGGAAAIAQGAANPDRHPGHAPARGRGRRGAAGGRGRCPGRGGRVVGAAPAVGTPAQWGVINPDMGPGGRTGCGSPAGRGVGPGRGRGRCGALARGSRGRGRGRAGRLDTIPVVGLGQGRVPRTAAAGAPLPDYSDTDSDEDTAPLVRLKSRGN